MQLIFHIAVLMATFGFMEFMAWFTHKYVMHGLLWYLHKTITKKSPASLSGTMPFLDFRGSVMAFDHDGDDGWQ